MPKKLPLIVLLPLLLAAGPSLADDAVKSLERFFNKVDTYTARFRQVVLDEGLNTLQETTGRMWIQRPGKFRWEYEPPFEQYIVGDGKHIWVYDPELEQASVRPMGGALGDTPAMLLAGRGNLKDSFKVKPLGKQGQTDWVQMIPKRNDGGFEDIRIGFEDGQIRSLEMVDGLGQVTRVTLSDAKENDAIDPKKFEFVPPPGVDVIGNTE